MCIYKYLKNVLQLNKTKKSSIKFCFDNNMMIKQKQIEISKARILKISKPLCFVYGSGYAIFKLRK